MRFKVIDRKTGNERTVSPKAYAAMGPKVYEKIGIVNDDGTETALGQSLPNRQTTQLARSVKGAAPVVVRTQLVAPVPISAGVTESPINIPTGPAPQLIANEDTPIKRKPGRQPGSKNKSISSNSTTDEK